MAHLSRIATRTSSARIAAVTLAVGALACAPLVMGLRADVTSKAPSAQLLACADNAPKDGSVSPLELRLALMALLRAMVSETPGCDMDGDGVTTTNDVALMVVAIRQSLAFSGGVSKVSSVASTVATRVSSVAATTSQEKCGDRKKTASEECDDGNAIDHDLCTNACKKPICGDGKKSLYEVCDDGNNDESDSCTSKCRAPGCGDGIVSGLEECDDANQNNLDGCTASCKKVPVGSITKAPAATCGNGIVETGEQCDDGNTNDNDLAGKVDGCSSVCLMTEKGAVGGSDKRCGDGLVQPELQEQCDDGNRNDADNCSNRCDMPVCGDGKRAGTEECDDGNGSDADFCSNTCRRPVCGNGTKEGTEECDDGNTVDGDACPSSCRLAASTCGNGIREGLERCDDANAMNTDACPNDCGVPICGNGKVETGEECDGNYGGRQDCTAHCTYSYCGDGVIQQRYEGGKNGNSVTEQCDDGLKNVSNTAFIGGQYTPYTSTKETITACSTSCVVLSASSAYCGDGVVKKEAGEECDDRNSIDYDGCTNACKKAVCGDGVVRTGFEQCDDGNDVNTDACTNLCEQYVAPGERCGNGIKELAYGEQCDDGNNSDGDGCTSNCKYPACGDGVVQNGPSEISVGGLHREECDDGEGNGMQCVPRYGETCSSCTKQCTSYSAYGGRCGDGTLQKDAGEECDDANGIDNDACSNTCKKGFCGDGVQQFMGLLEQCDDGSANGVQCTPAYGSSTCYFCGSSCKKESVNPGICGDRIVQRDGGEECDDGNTVQADGCHECKIGFCGDGVVQKGEECDDRNQNNGDICMNSCRYNRCGDGLVREGFEQCDDGNVADGDACTSACKLPICGDGVVSTGEECDDRNQSDYDACRNNCRWNVCGDGIIPQGALRPGGIREECDDGNRNNNDACSNECTLLPVCGNGIRERGEECETNRSGCDESCKWLPWVPSWMR